MSRVRIAIRAVVVVLAVAAPVSADAPVSGPDQQYENFDSRDRVITDRFTRLVWDRPATTSPYPARMTFADAKSYCGGSMRLPSLKELLTLVDELPHEEYDSVLGSNVRRQIDGSAFKGTPAEEFWTSSMNGDRVWTVHFGDGTTHDTDPGDMRRVRCVDSLPP